MSLSMRTVMPMVAVAGLIAAGTTSAVAAPAPGHRHTTPPAGRGHGITKVTGVTLPRTRLPQLPSRSAVQSPAWSGYAAVADGGKHVRFVTSDFTIPSLNCANSPDGSFAEHWAGLDGFNDSTSERVGVFAECSSGTPSYFAFYQMVPDPAVEFDGVNPGDAVKASVTFTGSSYNLVLTDITTGGSISTTQQCPAGSTCGNQSAEVITEDPGGGVASGFDLADFGMINDTGATVTAVGGKRGSLAALPGFWTSTKITLVDPANHPMAVPSALFGGKAFNTSWRTAT